MGGHQFVERFEQWQVRFRSGEAFGTAPAPNQPALADLLQKCIDQGRLSDPRFPCDCQDPATAAVSALESGAQEREFSIASHHDVRALVL
jgi:hypothetical protein